MRFLPTRLHAFVDYATAALLLALPWLLVLFAGEVVAEGWGPLLAVCVVSGVGLILLSLVTNYEGGLFPAFPMPVHLAVDAALGAVLIAAPWLFDFAKTFGEWTWAPFAAIGLMEIGAALCTHTRSPAAIPAEERPSGASGRAVAR